ncbi:hypothetical protein M404DRAFT_995927 [Pisolithus tinctorius Marx 270]|uniref:Uncharacterized protein n=1 Tax=Pisolithus tinctorius Marx 270 TaxID=870435 RepID=A0A0C3P8X9_PISTI|nr:hypothetical protein M404DRAFT_995927 [Pisolithus tinctorius Marx 270]
MRALAGSKPLPLIFSPTGKTRNGAGGHRTKEPLADSACYYFPFKSHECAIDEHAGVAWAGKKVCRQATGDLRADARPHNLRWTCRQIYVLPLQVEGTVKSTAIK